MVTLHISSTAAQLIKAALVEVLLMECAIIPEGTFFLRNLNASLMIQIFKVLLIAALSQIRLAYVD